MRAVPVSVALFATVLLVLTAGRLPIGDATVSATGVTAQPTPLRVTAAVPDPATTTPPSPPTTAPALSPTPSTSTTTQVPPTVATTTSTTTPPTTTPPTTTSTSPPETTTTSMAAIEPFHDAGFSSKLLSLVNGARASAGVNSLEWSSSLAGHAASWSRHLGEVGALSHSNLGSLLGNGWTSMGENVATGQTNPAAMHQGWMDSAGHRSNILNPAFTHVGIAVWVDSDGTAWGVQVFGG